MAKSISVKSLIFISLLLVSFLNASLGAAPLRIDALQAIEINGSKQWVLIRSSDPSNPILLYLHGGPGQSLIPFAHVATSSLTDRFTVVYWDQRGTGISYEAEFPAEKLNVKQLIEDTLAVTEFLKQRFAQKKIFLLRHSWGSLLGCLVVQKKPEEFHAFVGVGPVVSQRSLNEGRLNWQQRSKAIRFPFATSGNTAASHTIFLPSNCHRSWRALPIALRSTRLCCTIRATSCLKADWKTK
jgi:pimeloyl-ACP methyl ester carboxylesterase